jgi:hypothetical protein
MMKKQFPFVLTCEGYRVHTEVCKMMFGAISEVRKFTLTQIR